MSSTSRLGLLKPAPSDTVDVTAQLDNNYDLIDNAVGALVCTSTTRPSAPFSGQVIRESDTHNMLVYSGSGWELVAVAVATTGRPSAATAGVGAQVYDTTLGKPIWSNGSVWKDAAGNTV